MISLQRFLREYCLFGFFLEGFSLPSFFGRFFSKNNMVVISLQRFLRKYCRFRFFWKIFLFQVSLADKCKKK